MRNPLSSAKRRPRPRANASIDAQQTINMRRAFCYLQNVFFVSSAPSPLSTANSFGKRAPPPLDFPQNKEANETVSAIRSLAMTKEVSEKAPVQGSAFKRFDDSIG